MKNVLLIFSWMLVSISCSHEDNCQEISLSLQHLDCDNTWYAPHLDLENNYTIVRSKAIYDSQVKGACHPVIDFSRYDLVIGRQSSGNEVDTIKYDLRRTCPDQELTLTIDIVQSDATRPDNVVYHALIPKLGDEETLRVKIRVQ